MGVLENKRRLSQPDKVFLDSVGAGQEPAAAGIGGLLEVTSREGRMSGGKQGLSQHAPGLGGVGVGEAAKPGLPVRQQVGCQPDALDRAPVEPGDVRPGAFGHG